MTSAPRKENNGQAEADCALSLGMGTILFPVFCFLLLCACCPVWSFSPDELDVINGGMDNVAYKTNLLGYLGAKVAWGLLLTFGLATYPMLLLTLFSSFRRLFWRHSLERVGFEYVLAFPVFGFGLSILLGIWPLAFLPLQRLLNITTLPGGVIGQILSSPNGKLTLFMNNVGAAILAAIFILIAIRTIWFTDWRLLFLSRANGDDAAPGMLDKLKGRLAGKPKEPEESPGQDSVTPRSVNSQEPAFAKAVKKERQVPEARDEAPKKADADAQELPPPQLKKTDGSYTYPPLSLLDDYDNATAMGATAKEITINADIIQDTLDSFKIPARVVNQIVGPQVTLFEITMESAIKLSVITSLEDNIKMNLQAETIRILAPIPGKNMVGIEVPNKHRAIVSVKSLMQDKAWIYGKEQIPLLLGKNVSGKTIILDLAKAPHLLIAGTTGSGKSVCMNLLITSMLFKFSPEELRLIMVDPKVVEFNAYASLPHLVTPIINEVEKVPLALNWAINEMERRYRVLAKVGVRNLTDFNRRPHVEPAPLDDNGEPIPDRLPFIVVIIDELADIMAVAKKEVDVALARIAAKSRAVGIHTIIATQRPDTKVLTGTIKSNYPVRIAFRVPSQIDSMTILGGKGAESLLGLGDMIFVPPGASNQERLQCGMASDQERNDVVAHCAEQAPQHFNDAVLVADDEGDEKGGMEYADADSQDGERSLFSQAVDLVLRDKRPTISYLQRQLGIGYNKAATLMDLLEKKGVVGPQPSQGLRQILISSAVEVDDAEDDSY